MRAPASVASESLRNVQGSRSKMRRSHHQAKSRLPAMPTTGAPAAAATRSSQGAKTRFSQGTWLGACFHA